MVYMCSAKQYNAIQFAFIMRLFKKQSYPKETPKRFCNLAVDLKISLIS